VKWQEEKLKEKAVKGDKAHKEKADAVKERL